MKPKSNPDCYYCKLNNDSWCGIEWCWAQMVIAEDGEAETLLEPWMMGAAS